MLKDIFKNKTINDTKIGQCSHIGLVRNYNKDACGCFNTTKGELFLVADGMGVQKDGIKAAQLAISVIRKYIDKHEAPMKELLINAILAADKAIIKASKRLLTHRQFTMGSTVVLLLFRGDTVYYVHSGDSRLYLLRKDELRQLTRDHSQVQHLIDNGEASRGEATVHSLRNELTQYLGCELDATTLTVQKLACSNSDKFLLCTDGLWDMVSEEEIKSTLETPTSLQEQADSLIKSALKAGGDDNITVQIAQRQFFSGRYFAPIRETMMDITVLSLDISTLSLEHEEKKLEINRNLITHNPNDAQAQKDILISLYKIGYIYYISYNFSAALKAYEEALEISRKLVQNDPHNKYWQGEVATFLNSIAGVLKSREFDREDALSLSRESLKISRKLARHDPSNIQWQGNLMISLCNIGEILASDWQNLYVPSLVGEILTSVWQNLHVSSLVGLYNICEILASDWWKIARSLNAYHEALKISRKLVQLDLSNLQWQRSAIRSLYCIGVILLEKGNNNKALTVFQESLEMGRKLMICDPNNMPTHKDVVAALHQIAEILKAQGKFDEVLAIYQEAFEISSNIVKYDKIQGQWRSDNTWMNHYKYWRSIDFKFRSQNILAPYVEALEINHKLVSYDPDNIKWQIELVSSLCDVGEIFGILLFFRECDALNEEALEISRKLVQHDPSNMQAQSSLADALYFEGIKFERKVYNCSLADASSFGGIEFKRKSFGKRALTSYHECLEIRRKLVQHDPKNIQWNINLAASLVSIGLAYYRHHRDGICKENKASALFQESIDIVRKLVQFEPEHLGWRIDFAKSQKLVDHKLIEQGGVSRYDTLLYQEALEISFMKHNIYVQIKT